MMIINNITGVFITIFGIDYKTPQPREILNPKYLIFPVFI